MWNVEQKYSTSCGIACVAMLAEKKHSTVLKNAEGSFKRHFGETTSYTNRFEIKKLLKNFGVSWQGIFNSIKQDIQSQKKFWRALEGVNLVAVRFHIKDRTEYWHWIIADQSKNGLYIYDPDPKKGVFRVDLTKNGLPDQRSYKNAKWHLKIV